MGYSQDQRVQNSFQYFLNTQEDDGGWKCYKYSFGRGEETNYSTPNTTLIVLDAFRFTKHFNENKALDKAVHFLLEHWVIRKPISPCHYGIGKLFMQVEYPFRGYNLFHYVYVLQSKLLDGQIVVERVVPKLAKLSFCEKGKPSALATQRYQEILMNIGGDCHE